MVMQFCKKGAPPSRLNSIAKLMIGNWIGEFNRNRQWLSARPSQFLGNFSRRPFNSISVQGNVSLICPYLSKTKSDQSKKDGWDTWNKNVPSCTNSNNRASKIVSGVLYSVHFCLGPLVPLKRCESTSKIERNFSWPFQTMRHDAVPRVEGKLRTKVGCSSIEKYQ